MGVLTPTNSATSLLITFSQAADRYKGHGEGDYICAPAPVTPQIESIGVQRADTSDALRLREDARPPGA